MRLIDHCLWQTEPLEMQAEEAAPAAFMPQMPPTPKSRTSSVASAGECGATKVTADTPAETRLQGSGLFESDGEESSEEEVVLVPIRGAGEAAATTVTADTAATVEPKAPSSPILRSVAQVKGRAMAHNAIEEWQPAGVDMDTGRMFYVNSHTRETVWERPFPGEQAKHTPGEKPPPPCPLPEGEELPGTEPEPASLAEQAGSLLLAAGHAIAYQPEPLIFEKLDSGSAEPVWYQVLQGCDVGLRLRPAYEPRGEGGLKAGTIFQAVERVAAEGTLFVRTPAGGWIFQHSKQGKQVLAETQVEIGMWVYQARRPVAARSSPLFGSERLVGIEAGALLKAKAKVVLDEVTWLRGEQGWCFEAWEGEAVLDLIDPANLEAGDWWHWVAAKGGAVLLQSAMLDSAKDVRLKHGSVVQSDQRIRCPRLAETFYRLTDGTGWLVETAPDGCAVLEPAEVRLAAPGTRFAYEVKRRARLLPTATQIQLSSTPREIGPGELVHANAVVGVRSEEESFVHLTDGTGWLCEVDLELTKDLDPMETLALGAHKAGRVLGDAFSTMSSMIAEGLQTPPKSGQQAGGGLLQQPTGEAVSYSPSNWGQAPGTPPPAMSAEPIDNRSMVDPPPQQDIAQGEVAAATASPGGSITGLGIRDQASKAAAGFSAYWSGWNANGGPRGD